MSAVEFASRRQSGRMDAETTSSPELGPLALLGGCEHRDGCGVIDRWLMDRAGRSRVRVTVIPAASPAARLPATAALARNYWTELGADVTVAVPTTGPLSPQVESALAEPDIVVLTGGVPGRLVRTLGASPVWERVLELWRGGTALSGSSAGAIGLFTWRLALCAPRPLQVVPGLGPLRDYVCVPHFDRFVSSFPAMHPWVRRRERGLRGLSILGLDEGTALVADGDRHEVVGRGSVTLVNEDGWHTSPAGGTVDLNRPLALPHQLSAFAA
jgi:cyanophycinase-like exopeptidase